MKNPFVVLLGKALLFAVSVFAIDFLIGFSFSKMRDYGYSKNKMSYELLPKYCIEDATPEIAIIGSSTASHHYISKQIEDSVGMSVYNFGQDGSFFLYQNSVINLMLDRYSPRVIIWEIGESCLSSAYDNRWEYQNMSQLYPWYSDAYVRNVVDNKDTYQRFRMLSKSYINNSFLLMYLRLCLFDCNVSNAGYIPLKDGEFGFADRIRKKGESFVPEKGERLKRTLQKCKSKGVQVVFTSSPRFLGDEIKSNDYYQELRNIANQYNIPFLDYYNIEPFCNNQELFRDNCHMNHFGTELYMEKFIPNLKTIIDSINSSTLVL